MVFSSITFLLYFMPVFFLVYYLIPYKFKNYWLVASSLLFYSWGAPLFIFAFVASSLIDYFATTQFHKSNGKWFLFASILLNVLLLGYFKYSNFFIDNFNFISETLFGSKIPWSNVILPIGISFLTFEKISYLIDVYRKDCEAQRNYMNYLLFVILFPHQIAGPIVRYKEVGEQINNRKANLTPVKVYEGLLRFIIGLSKKVLIANVLGEQVNDIFKMPSEELTFTSAWVGIIAYSFQIYFDFSGYSDMAIGMGKMLGFKFPENFNFPYSSKSITEFWKRWHMTLGNWMKDYLYIPLGGNRGNNTYLNLMIVFFLSGLWHGASWNFVIWGVFHGSFLVAERIGMNTLLKKVNPVPSTLYTFLVVITGWVFFRAENLSYAYGFLKTMYSIPVIDSSLLENLNTKFYFVLILALLFSFKSERVQKRLTALYTEVSNNSALNWLIMFSIVVLYLFNLGELLATGFNPFIYFKF
ncbi:MAG: MBOAT family protein [Bacteroidetes bacterium]|nr:MBOAT family protein [Bacteroidota bacterium]